MTQYNFNLIHWKKNEWIDGLSQKSVRNLECSKTIGTKAVSTKTKIPIQGLRAWVDELTVGLGDVRVFFQP